MGFQKKNISSRSEKVDFLKNDSRIGEMTATGRFSSKTQLNKERKKKE